MDLLDILLFGTLSFVVAGTIKGLVGTGLPTAAIALLTLFIGPRVAISLILLPMLLTNLWQVYREGGLLETARRYRVFAPVLFVVTGATAILTRDVQDRVLLGVLGVVILLFAAFSWKGWVPRIAPRHDRAAQAVFGVIAGILAGLTSGWAVPMAIYLTMSGAGKSDWMRATGYLIFVGTIPLTAAYVWAGHMTAPLFGLSALMILPTLAGFAAGEALRNRLSVEQFRNMILIMFAILGLNLLRRAIWYD